MNLKRKQKKGRRNQSGQRQRHKAVSAGCQFWFKPAPSKARSFASVLARVVPTPALAPLDKKHQRSSGCGLPYHLKQRPCWELSAFTWPLSHENPQKKQVTKLTWPLSSAPVPVSHDPTSAEVQSHVKQCPTNLMDCECRTPLNVNVTHHMDQWWLMLGMKAYLAQLISTCLAILFRFRLGLVWKFFT